MQVPSFIDNEVNRCPHTKLASWYQRPPNRQGSRRQAAAKEHGGKMGGLELLGFLAIVIGVIGIIVLLKSRKKSDR